MARDNERNDDAPFDTVAMDDPEVLRQLVERALQRFLEAENDQLDWLFRILAASAAVFPQLGPSVH